MLTWNMRRIGRRKVLGRRGWWVGTSRRFHLLPGVSHFSKVCRKCAQNFGGKRRARSNDLTLRQGIETVKIEGRFAALLKIDNGPQVADERCGPIQFVPFFLDFGTVHSPAPCLKRGDDLIVAADYQR